MAPENKGHELFHALKASRGKKQGIQPKKLVVRPRTETRCLHTFLISKASSDEIEHRPHECQVMAGMLFLIIGVDLEPAVHGIFFLANEISLDLFHGCFREHVGG